MAVKFYLDAHVPHAIATALSLRGVDVLTAQQDRTDTLSDAALLQRATALGRIFVSQDEDLLAEARHLQHQGIPFAGLLYGHQQQLTIGTMVEDLHLIATATGASEWANTVGYLPL